MLFHGEGGWGASLYKALGLKSLRSSCRLKRVGQRDFIQCFRPLPPCSPSGSFQGFPFSSAPWIRKKKHSFGFIINTLLLDFLVSLPSLCLTLIFTQRVNKQSIKDANMLSNEIELRADFEILKRQGPRYGNKMLANPSGPSFEECNIVLHQ